MVMIEVLIVEDDELLRSGMRLIIEGEEDLQVCGLAGNGQEARAYIRNKRPDLVLLDLQMPIMDGITCLQEIRRTDQELIVLVLTTFNEEEYIFEALACGANGYLLKSIDFRKLLTTIREAMNKQYVLPAEVAAKVAKYAMSNSAYKQEKGLLRYFEQDNPFTKKEQQIVALLLHRFTNKEIADRLFLSEGTIKNNLTVIYGKLGVSNWQGAVQRLEQLALDYS
jgi:DNA-binding NarL/FixJ family response regulator